MQRYFSFWSASSISFSRFKTSKCSVFPKFSSSSGYSPNSFCTQLKAKVRALNEEPRRKRRGIEKVFFSFRNLVPTHKTEPARIFQLHDLDFLCIA